MMNWGTRQAWKDAREADTEARRDRLREAALANHRRRKATVVTLQWWPLGEPIPDGWRVARQKHSHHSRYSVLIEKVETP